MKIVCDKLEVREGTPIPLLLHVSSNMSEDSNDMARIFASANMLMSETY